MPRKKVCTCLVHERFFSNTLNPWLVESANIECVIFILKHKFKGKILKARTGKHETKSVD